MKLITLMTFAMLANWATSQTQMNIHINDGSVVTIPVNTIDSITYTIAPVGSGLYTVGAGVSDINGNNYSTIVIQNGQEWMSENLNVDQFSNGNAIANITDGVAWQDATADGWCYYNNDPANGPIYGKLYNWYVVNDSRNVCPTGWHVPNQADWAALTGYLGTDAFEIATKMKSIGSIPSADGLWSSANDGTNESGFNALPGGYRSGISGNSGAFLGFGINGLFWSSDEFNLNNAHRHNVDLFIGYNTTNWDKETGLYIRCVKD